MPSKNDHILNSLGTPGVLNKCERYEAENGERYRILSSLSTAGTSVNDTGLERIRQIMCSCCNERFQMAKISHLYTLNFF